MGKAVRRAVKDTWKLFGWKPATFVGLAALAGAVTILIRVGVDWATIWSLVGGRFVVLTGGLYVWVVTSMFLVNLACAPYRNARDEIEVQRAARRGVEDELAKCRARLTEISDRRPAISVELSNRAWPKREGEAHYFLIVRNTGAPAIFSAEFTTVEGPKRHEALEGHWLLSGRRAAEIPTDKEDQLLLCAVIEHPPRTSVELLTGQPAPASAHGRHHLSYWEPRSADEQPPTSVVRVSIRADPELVDGPWIAEYEISATTVRRVWSDDFHKAADLEGS